MASGADPGKVIDRMAALIGEQAKTIAILQCVTEEQEQENSRLRAQLADNPTTN
jgi:hypothetical protein